jgi:hypothetical protein
MNEPKFKYLINYYVATLPISLEEFTKSLENEFHIPQQIFHRDRLIFVGDSNDIPFARLRIYAFLLGTSVDLLINRNSFAEK